MSTWHVGLPASWRPITSWARIFMGGPIRNCCISLLFRCVIGPIVFAPRNYSAGESPKGTNSQVCLPAILLSFLPSSLRSRTLRHCLTSGSAKIISSAISVSKNSQEQCGERNRVFNAEEKDDVAPTAIETVNIMPT